MSDVRIDGTLRVTGNLQVNGSLPTVSRSDLSLESDQIFSVPLQSLRVWDAIQTNLPGTSATDDLAYSGGTFGTDSPHITTGDVKASSVTRYARFVYPLPVEYQDGQTVKLRLSAGMETTVSDTSATVDVVAYRSDRETGIGSDICATAATTINSLTFANVDFTLTPTTLAAGDVLDIRIAIAVVDSATATAVIAAIGAIELLCDIKG